MRARGDERASESRDARLQIKDARLFIFLKMNELIISIHFGLGDIIDTPYQVLVLPRVLPRDTTRVPTTTVHTSNEAINATRAYCKVTA